MQIQFLGAASQVTGSCRLFKAAGKNFLLDCGMFQGNRTTYEQNLTALDFRAMGMSVNDLDFVLLSHAHADHCALLPLLHQRGYRGAIHATPATADLANIIMQDSAHIQESEAQTRNRILEKRARKVGANHKHTPTSTPLYTMPDAVGAGKLFVTHAYQEVFSPAPGIKVRFSDAGHILGSAIVEIFVTEAPGAKELVFVFSGDLGQPNRPIVEDPSPVHYADYVMVESTYGNRLHKPIGTTREEICKILNDTLPHGNVVIPAFALGRTQELLVMLAQFAQAKSIPAATVYIDSPLAQKATAITLKHANITDDESRRALADLESGRLSLKVVFTETAQESQAINAIPRGAIILAGSGMCEAGRIRHHLRHNLGKSQASVIFTGYQAEGSLGRRLIDGATEVRLFDDTISVNAKIHTVGGMSAHADQASLIAWLRGFSSPPKQCLLVHGEAEALNGFALAIKEQLGWTTHIALDHETLQLA